MIGAIIGNALGLGLKIMDKMEKNSDKHSFEEFKARKKEMDNSLADADVEGVDSMFEYLAERARGGNTGRKCLHEKLTDWIVFNIVCWLWY